MKALKASLFGLGAMALLFSACGGQKAVEPELTLSGLDAAKFDTVLVNDILEESFIKAERLVKLFTGLKPKKV